MLVLASNSPRRRQLLEVSGWDFVVHPAPVDEDCLPGEAPEFYVLRLAEMKARAALDSWDKPLPPVAIFLGADTTVSIDGEILGKPSSAIEAVYMLTRLRGRTHQVYTALAILRPADSRCLKDVCVSTVTMRSYRDDEITCYVESGDPLDKAGAYAIQHTGFQPVARVQGCYANVVGLPICHLGRLLQTLNIQARSLPWLACQEATGIPCEIYQEVLGEEIIV
jgi:MAF protein